MIPLIQAEMFKRKWLTEEEFPDIIAIAQSAPGLIAVNISIFIGYRLKGTKGSIVATIGSILPPFVIILLVAAFFANFQDNPIVVKAFKGIRPVVVALILVPMLQMARSSNKTWWAWVITAASLILVAFLNVSPIYILLVILVLGFSAAKFREKSIENHKGTEDRK